LEISLQPVVQNLEREAALYEELLTLALSQQEHLVARRTDALSEIARRQAELFQEGHRLEAEGRAAMEGLRVRLGLREVRSLSAFLSHLDPGFTKPVRELRERLLALVHRLEEVQAVNTALFETAMDSVRNTMQVLVGCSSTPASPFGGLAEAPRSLLVDQRA
jgi:hypothetical protein